MAFKKGQSGNPKGRAKGTVVKPQFRDFIKPKDIKTFVEYVLSTYMESEKVTVWLGDQIFGKAAQGVELTGKDGDVIRVDITTQLSKVYGDTP